MVPISETLWLNVPVKRPLERSSLHDAYAKNQLDCLISSTSYVMDKTHNFRKNKNKKKNEMIWNEKSKNLALLGLAVQVEYLSNLYN